MYNACFQKWMYIKKVFDETKHVFNSMFGNRIKRRFDSELVYTEKHLKIKMRYYKGKINTNFHDDGCQNKVFVVFVYQ